MFNSFFHARKGTNALPLIFACDIMKALYVVGQFARKRSRCSHYKRREVMCMSNLDLFMALIAVASLALTIYFGKR